MSKVVLKTDINGRALQSLTPSTTSVNGAISGSSVRIALPTGASVIRVAATSNCYLEFGDVTVVAASTDMVFPTGVEVLSVNPSWTHVAIIQVGADTGVLSVTEMN